MFTAFKNYIRASSNTLNLGVGIIKLFSLTFQHFQFILNTSTFWEKFLRKSKKFQYCLTS